MTPQYRPRGPEWGPLSPHPPVVTPDDRYRTPPPSMLGQHPKGGGTRAWLWFYRRRVNVSADCAVCTARGSATPTALLVAMQAS